MRLQIPWGLPDPRFVLEEDKNKREKERRRKSAEALAKQEYKPEKSLFSKAISGFGDALSGAQDVAESAASNVEDFVTEDLPDTAQDIGGGLWKGLETYGQTTQGALTGPFTEGKVEDGEYTTDFNLGNPLSNLQSHVEAQRETGQLRGQPSNPFSALFKGAEAARNIGRAYEQDPDVPAGIKFGTGVISDPLSYTGVGLATKIPKIGGLLRGAGAGRKIARGGINLAEGFDSPATVAGFAAGGGAAVEAADRYDIPGIPEPAEQLGAGLLGGVGGAGIVGKLRRASNLSQQMDGPIAEAVGPGGMRRTPEQEAAQEALDDSRELLRSWEAEPYGTPDRTRMMDMALDDIRREKAELEELGGMDSGIPTESELQTELEELFGEMDEVQREAFMKAWGEDNYQGIGDPLVDTALDLQGKVDNYTSFRRIREGMTTEKPLLSEVEESVPELQAREEKVRNRLMEVYREEGTSYRPGRADELAQLEDELTNIRKQLNSSRRIKSYSTDPEEFRQEYYSRGGTSYQDMEDAQLLRALDTERAKTETYDDNPRRPDVMEASARVSQIEEELRNRGIDDPNRALEQLDSDTELFQRITEGQDVRDSEFRYVLGKEDDDALRAFWREAQEYEGPPQDSIADMRFKHFTQEEMNRRFPDEVENPGEVPYRYGQTTPETTTASRNAELREVSDEQLRTELRNLEELEAEDNLSVYGQNQLNLVRRELESRRVKAPEPAPQTRTESTGLEHLDEDQLQRQARQLEQSGLPESDKAILRKTYQRELTRRGIDIRGGREAESLVDLPENVPSGLTLGQRARNLVTDARRVLTGHGVRNDATATPIAHQYADIHQTIQNQTEIANRAALTLELSLQKPGAWKRGWEQNRTSVLVDEINGRQIEPAALSDIAWDYSQYRDMLNPFQRDLMEQLRRSMEDFKRTLEEAGVDTSNWETPSDPDGFYLPRDRVLGGVEETPELRPEILPKGGGTKGFEKQRRWRTVAQAVEKGQADPPVLNEAISSYGKDVADRVADAWLMNQVKRLKPSSKSRSTGTVSLQGVTGLHSVHLPREISDVLNREINQIKGVNKSEADQLYSDINNTLRAVWATGDASRIGIQSLTYFADNPHRAFRTALIAQKTLAQPEMLGKYILRHDEKAYGTSRPTVQEMVRAGMEMTQATGAGTDIGGISRHLERIPVAGTTLKKANRLFSESANLERINQFDMLWEQYNTGRIPFLTHIRKRPGLTREEIMREIADTVNRTTGHARQGFGGNIGQAIMFAPRFFQSQIETVLKAATPSSKIQNQIARRQLAKTIALGTTMTFAINEARGYETEWKNPTNSNWMRIRDVGGVDISIFGPWDSLARGFVQSVPHIDHNGDFTLGDPSYMLRTKLSPALSTAMALVTGKTFLGEDIGPKHPEELFRQIMLPFAVREVGREPVTSMPLNFFGIKSTPLSNREKVENMMRNDGIDPDDPDYLIRRREWLAENQDKIPESTYEEGQRSQEVREDISKRRARNEEALEQNKISLPTFRHQRSQLLREQRIRLEEIYDSDDRPDPDTEQGEWLASYFLLFDEATNEVTGDIDSDKFDPLVVQWEREYGSEAKEFIDEYLGAGLGPREQQYYEDMQTLDSAGYFDAPRYRGMQSDLTEDEIDEWARLVDSIRAANPDQTENISWAETARAVLTDLSSNELRDIINSRKEAYESPEIKRLKREYGKELLWFNPRATWSTYRDYTPRKGGGVGSLGLDLGTDLGTTFDTNLNMTL